MISNAPRELRETREKGEYALLVAEGLSQLSSLVLFITLKAFEVFGALVPKMACCGRAKLMISNKGIPKCKSSKIFSIVGY